MVYTLHDRRLGGVDRLILSDRPRGLMRLADDLLKSVFFFCVQEPNGSISFRATGFFASMPLAENPDTQVVYAITARHVNEEAAKHQQAFLRVNTVAGGSQLVSWAGAKWIFPDNPASDVAILPWAPPQSTIDYRVIPRSMFADQETLDRESIGIGDDIAMIGLFSMLHGNQRNQPIVRLGHIAALPEEPMIDDDTGLEYHALLAEIRSIGGLSGSPVFACLEPGRVKAGVIDLSRKMFLLGLVRGHWDVKRQPADVVMADAESVNVGIALITPVADILTLLDGEELSAQRRAADRQRTKDKAPTPD